MDQTTSSSMQISDTEVSNIRDYIRSKNTAVLTIMFTDIEGFTDATELHGEDYSRRARHAHDEIVVACIQEGGAGMVVKFIGDAVMAVFAEPSAAVERSLKIQERLAAFNAGQDEFDDINIRIGLHMGQVAVEDSIELDVFGRHVNRAARIESLAAGGQIMMCHAVFDSARGWLQNHKELTWHLHGEFRLKGIPEAVPIYEVCLPGRKPRPPAKAKPVRRGLPGLAAAVALVVVGALAAWGLTQFQQAEVFLERFYPEKLYLDGAELLALEGEPRDPQRRISNEIRPGRHLLHYDVHKFIRYYAPVKIERGVNVLNPQWEESRLPLISHAHGITSNTRADKRTFVHDTPFFYYDGDGERFERAITLQLRVDSTREKQDAIRHVITWQISGDGKVIREGVEQAVNDAGSSDTVHGEPKILLEDPPLRYYLKYRMRGQYIYAEMGAVFEQYQP